MRIAAGMIVLLALASMAAPVSASDQPQAGLLLLLDSWSDTVLPMPLASLRQTVTDRLEQGLRESGRSVVATGDLMSLAGRHRMRGGNIIPAAFLADLSSELDAGELLVAQLVVAPHRLTLLVRGLATADGVVQEIWQAEQILERMLSGDDPQAEASALLVAVDSLVDTAVKPRPRTVPVARSRVALLLPARAAGCGDREADQATHGMLAAMLETDDLQIIDPAYTAAMLIGAGHHPDRLDAQARRLLATTFDTRYTLQPMLLAYGNDQSSDGRGAVFDRDWVVLTRSTIQSFWLTLTCLDLVDGTLAAAADIFVQHTARTGWFGLVDDTPLLTRLDRASRQLWHDARTPLEDIRHDS